MRIANKLIGLHADKWHCYKCEQCFGQIVQWFLHIISLIHKAPWETIYISFTGFSAHNGNALILELWQLYGDIISGYTAAYWESTRSPARAANRIYTHTVIMTLNAKPSIADGAATLCKMPVICWKCLRMPETPVLKAATWTKGKSDIWYDYRATSQKVMCVS